MQFHRGRLVDHIHLRVADLQQSKQFYAAVFDALGHQGVIQEGEDFFYADELFVNQAEGYITQVHLAFQAPDQAAVDQFYHAAISAGGREFGAPGERPYHPGYYAAFVLDPDGNNIEAVYHGPVRRSSAAVVLEPVENII